MAPATRDRTASRSHGRALALGLLLAGGCSTMPPAPQSAPSALRLAHVQELMQAARTANDVRDPNARQALGRAEGAFARVRAELLRGNVSNADEQLARAEADAELSLALCRRAAAEAGAAVARARLSALEAAPASGDAPAPAPSEGALPVAGLQRIAGPVLVPAGSAEVTTESGPGTPGLPGGVAPAPLPVVPGLGGAPTSAPGGSR